MEILHRRTASRGAYLENEEFEKVKAELLAALPESIPREIKEAFQGKLEHFNEVSLRRRLKDLLNRCDEDTKQAITSSPKEFVDKIVGVRNYLTHYDEPPRGGEPKALELLETAASMQRLLVAVLFRELGVDAGAIIRSIEKIEALPMHWYR